MTELYFEDERPLVSNVPQPRLATQALLALLALKVLLKMYYTNISKVKCPKEIGHFQSAGRSSYKVPTVKSWKLSVQIPKNAQSPNWAKFGLRTFFWLYKPNLTERNKNKWNTKNKPK